ncbi:MAG TPA: hypothetical protein V6C72_02155, partial [Chroococcales cyanobacterium]
MLRRSETAYSPGVSAAQYPIAWLNRQIAFSGWLSKLSAICAFVLAPVTVFLAPIAMAFDMPSAHVVSEDQVPPPQ